MLRCLAWRWLLATLLLVGLLPASAAGLRDEDVRAAIRTLADRIMDAQKADGSWDYPGYPVGITALMTLALHQAGVADQDRSVIRATDYLLRSVPRTTYGEGLVLCALEPWVERPPVQARMQKALDFLCRIQGPDGGWSYRSVGGHDFSNTQFAVLGLGAAQRVGLPVPADAVKRVRELWLQMQNRDGGWGYRDHSSSSLSMSCAGVASLSLLGLELELPGERCGTYVYNPALQRGIAYIGNLLGQGGVAFARNQWPYYTWYAVERVAIFLDLKTIGGIDWYRRGAEAMMQVVRLPGGIENDAFALLFLAKAATPIAIAKWQWQGDWNNDHFDVRNWLRHSSQTLGQPLDWVATDLNSLKSPAAKACLLYVNGHQRFQMTPQEVEFLRAFLQDGGTVVGEPCCGSKEFLTSFAAVIQQDLYPGQKGRFEPLPPSHSVHSAVHRLTGSEVGIFQLRFGGCRRKRVFLLDRDMGCALNGEPGMVKFRPLAEKIADNLLAYAMQERRPAGKLDEKELAKDEMPRVVLTAPELALGREDEAAQFRCPLGRLKHRGDWQADPHFFSSMQRVLGDQSAVPEFDGEVGVDPSTATLFSVPVLFVNGHGDLRFSQAEVANLRSYLQNGGAMVVSACCSSLEFDQGFRPAVAQILPNDRLEEVPLDDALWQRPFDLRGWRPQGNARLVQTYPDRWGPVLGVRRQGRWIVLYSPVDFCCAFEGDLENDVLGYDLQAASRLYINFLAEVMRIE